MPPSLFAELRAAWLEPQRAYHSLRHFLARPAIYSTPELRQLWETRARSNLAAVLAALEPPHA